MRAFIWFACLGVLTNGFTTTPWTKSRVEPKNGDRLSCLAGDDDGALPHDTGGADDDLMDTTVKALFANEVDTCTGADYDLDNVACNAFYNDNGQGLVEVIVPEMKHPDDRSPVSMVVVLDVSYSMDEAAVMYGDSEGSAGLSVLDVVKHSTRTIIESLEAKDKLAVVTYASDSATLMNFAPMTTANRASAWQAVDRLATRGNTNLYGGLQRALDLVSEAGEGGVDTHILLLTDGMPNVSPPRGELETLNRYLQSHPALKTQISTFGFGYNLDSLLLKQLADRGGGYFGFIPDASFVGTVFINALANIMATATFSDAILQIRSHPESCDNGGPGLTISSGQSWTPSPSGINVQLPPLLFGQTLQILVDFNGKQPSNFSVGFQGKAGVLFTSNGVAENSLAVSGNFKTATRRSAIVHLISEANDIPWRQAHGLYNSTIGRLSSLGMLDDRCPLTLDLRGQIGEAFSRLDWFSRWGKPYLLSLLSAHTMQQCSNFKDPGVQGYASTTFTHFRDKAEALFCTLPAPTPSRSRDDRISVPLTSMRAYFDPDAPCFAAGDVWMVNGTKVPVDLVQAGDEVLTSSGVDKVLCVVKTPCDTGEIELVALPEDVWVTPWHPIRTSGSDVWQFPVDVAPTFAVSGCKFVYSFVLLHRSSGIRIGSVEGITLAHGIQGDPVASHPFLGTEKLIEDLSRFDGWDQGLVQLGPNPLVRDSSTSLIVGFKHNNTSREYR